jgi:hypothetical protein
MEKKKYSAPQLETHHTVTMDVIAASDTYKYNSASESGTEFGSKEHTDNSTTNQDFWGN